jgi:copper chaperone CopZ
MERPALELDGMGCGGCVTNVKRALGEVPGVSVEDVTIGKAEVRYDPQKTSPRAIAEAMEQAGYLVRRGVPPSASAR